MSSYQKNNYSNPGADDRRLQDIFRRNAQKQIVETKKRLGEAGSNSFLAMQERAYEKAMQTLRKFGILNKHNEVIKVTKSESDHMFNTYYEVFLNSEKASLQKDDNVPRATY